MDLRDENSLNKGKKENEKNEKQTSEKGQYIQNIRVPSLKCDWCTVSLGPRFLYIEMGVKTLIWALFTWH